MWSRKRLDIGWSDLAAGAVRACFPPDSARAERGVAAPWPEPDKMLPCLSVRSGFDLLLSALALPAGSEVLVSAITIADMVRIIEEHGLAPVPVNLAPQRMAPEMEHWQAAVTPATKAILVAHLMGGRVEMEPVLEFARRHGLLVFEDCAQAFAGTQYQGHVEADASMFSFGVIKSSTALGGAVLRVRDAELLRRMRQGQAAWPVQSRWRYLKRLVKYGTFKLLTSPPACGAITGVCRAWGGITTAGSTGRPGVFPAAISSGRSASGPLAAAISAGTAFAELRCPSLAATLGKRPQADANFDRRGRFLPRCGDEPAHLLGVPGRRQRTEAPDGGIGTGGVQRHARSKPVRGAAAGRSDGVHGTPPPRNSSRGWSSCRSIRSSCGRVPTDGRGGGGGHEAGAGVGDRPRKSSAAGSEILVCRGRAGATARPWNGGQL